MAWWEGFGEGPKYAINRAGLGFIAFISGFFLRTNDGNLSR
jgi:hypothetical protein